MNTHSSQSTIGAEVLISSGLHQWQHGQIESIDTATQIPFAIVQLRGYGGALLVTKQAYIPLKYCAIFDAEAMRAEAKSRRKAQKVLP